MNSISVSTQNTGEIVVHGALLFSTIDKKTAGLLANYMTTDHLVVDLIQVKQADSAGLALLIEWIKQARQKNRKICFKNIPEQLQALATLSGFDRSDYFILNCTTQT